MNSMRCPKCHGKMCFEIALELLERVASLEHLSNQHDILLISLLNGTNQNDVLKLCIKSTIERLDTMLEKA